MQTAICRSTRSVYGSKRCEHPLDDRAPTDPMTIALADARDASTFRRMRLRRSSTRAACRTPSRRATRHSTISAALLREGRRRRRRRVRRRLRLRRRRARENARDRVAAINIMRDVAGTGSSAGLPATGTSWRQHGVTGDDIAHGRVTPGWRSLITRSSRAHARISARAEAARHARPAALCVSTFAGLYSGQLDRIESNGFDDLRPVMPTLDPAKLAVGAGLVGEGCGRRRWPRRADRSARARRRGRGSRSTRRSRRSGAVQTRLRATAIPSAA